jgi:pimeloyl-ACP methyl ester carboxylesterase
VLDCFDVEDVTLVGISLGGYLAPRAAAFEPRVARVVAFDVMFDFFECATSHAGAFFYKAGRAIAGAHAAAPLVNAALEHMMATDATIAWGLRQGMHVTGTTTPAAFLEHIKHYTLVDVSSRIHQDFLLLAGADDHHVPLAQFFRQAEALTHVRSLTTRLFTKAESAGSHCQYGNLDLALAVIADWIHERSRAH